MLAVVPRELVAARKLPPAAFPIAVIRLLARVRAHMCLEVRALRVSLVTLRVWTLVKSAAGCYASTRCRLALLLLRLHDHFITAATQTRFRFIVREQFRLFRISVIKKTII